MMLIVSCYNIFANAYYSAFGIPESISLIVFDYSVEIMFLLDMIFCFCQEYKDEETYTMVSDIKRIAKNYIKGSFVFDLMAWLPIE